MYPAYERFARAGIKNVCIHKGLFAPSVAKQFPNLLAYADVSDVGKAAQRLAAAQFRHLPLRLPPCRRLPGRCAWRNGTRPAAVPGSATLPTSRQIRRHQRLRRSRSVVRLYQHRRTPPCRRADGHAGQGPGRRPRHLGHRRGLDRRSAMADRGPPPPGNPRGHAEGHTASRRSVRPTARSSAASLPPTASACSATTAMPNWPRPIVSPRSSRTTSVTAPTPAICATAISGEH